MKVYHYKGPDSLQVLELKKSKLISEGYYGYRKHTKSLAELYKSLLSELKPNWKIEIIVEDNNLYKLGFVDEILCSLNLDVSKEEISELHDEIMNMEISVYLHEDLLYKNLLNMSEKEKKEYRELKKREKEYNKYAPLEALSSYWLQ